MFDCKEEHYDFLVLLEKICEKLRTAHISCNTDLICELNNKIVRHMRKKDEPAF